MFQWHVAYHDDTLRQYYRILIDVQIVLGDRCTHAAFYVKYVIRTKYGGSIALI